MNSFTFTSIELRDILISVLALTVIFAYPNFLTSVEAFLVYLGVVVIAFMGHELSHKYTAIKLGFHSEYRMWPQGLLLALVMAVATGGRMLFAAPGAVYFASRWAFQSHPSRKDVGKIGASGPAFNIVAGSASLIALWFTRLDFFLPLAMFNLWLAIFNLIPFGPIDGAKILRWDPKIWGSMVALAVSMYIVLISI